MVQNVERVMIRFGVGIAAAIAVSLLLVAVFATKGRTDSTPVPAKSAIAAPKATAEPLGAEYVRQRLRGIFVKMATQYECPGVATGVTIDELLDSWTDMPWQIRYTAWMVTDAELQAEWIDVMAEDGISSREFLRALGGRC